MRLTKTFYLPSLWYIQDIMAWTSRHDGISDIDPQQRALLEKYDGCRRHYETGKIFTDVDFFWGEKSPYGGFKQQLLLRVKFADEAYARRFQDMKHKPSFLSCAADVTDHPWYQTDVLLESGFPKIENPIDMSGQFSIPQA